MEYTILIRQVGMKQYAIGVHHGVKLPVLKSHSLTTPAVKPHINKPSFALRIT